MSKTGDNVFQITDALHKPMHCTKSHAFERRRRGNRVARGERSVAPGLLQKSARALKERQKRMFVSHFQRSMETAGSRGFVLASLTRPLATLFRAGGAPTYSAPVALQLIPRRWRSKPEFFVQSRSPMHVEVL